MMINLPLKILALFQFVSVHHLILSQAESKDGTVFELKDLPPEGLKKKVAKVEENKYPVKCASLINSFSQKKKRFEMVFIEQLIYDH